MAPKTETIPASTFARDHGVTVETVRTWIVAGMPYRSEPSGRRVVRAEANRWLREEIRRKALAEVSPGEVDERVRKTRIEADLKELELQERRHELVPADTYRERAEAFVGGFGAVAAGRLARFERDIVTAHNEADARTLTQGIHVALMQGAQEYADQLEAERQLIEEAAA